MEKFSHRLKKLRIKKGLSLHALAKATNISPSTLSSWENAKTIPRAKDFITLVKFFDVSADYLLGICQKPKET